MRRTFVLTALHNLIRKLVLRKDEHTLSETPGLLQVLSHRSFPFSRFEKIIEYHPRSWKYFLESLLHRSYLQYLDVAIHSNERLEFLGDAVLNFLVADFLHTQYPHLAEGNLTKYRSRLVNRRILAQRAKELNISEFLFLSPSASQSLDSGSDSILADSFEALIGALYLDGGMEAAKAFVERNLLQHIDMTALISADDNYKSALLEHAQSRSLGIPKYSLLKEEGPDHDRRFTIEVLVGTESYGVGTGRSKKDAEQAAAFMALEKIQFQSTNQN